MQGFAEEADIGLFTFYHSEPLAERANQFISSKTITKKRILQFNQEEANGQPNKKIVKKDCLIINSPLYKKYKSVESSKIHNNLKKQHIQSQLEDRPDPIAKTIKMQRSKTENKQIVQINLECETTRKNTKIIELNNLRPKTQLSHISQRSYDSIYYRDYLNQTASINIKNIGNTEAKQLFKSKKQILLRLQAKSRKTQLKMNSIISRCFAKHIQLPPTPRDFNQEIIKQNNAELKLDLSPNNQPYRNKWPHKISKFEQIKFSQAEKMWKNKKETFVLPEHSKKIIYKNKLNEYFSNHFPKLPNNHLEAYNNNLTPIFKNQSYSQSISKTNQ